MAQKKETKKIKARDLKPKKDAKGGFMITGAGNKQSGGSNKQSGGGNKQDHLGW